MDSVVDDPLTRIEGACVLEDESTSGGMLLAVRGLLVVVIFDRDEKASDSSLTIDSLSLIVGDDGDSASGSAVVVVVVDVDVDVDVVLLAGLLFRRDTNLSGRLTSGCSVEPPLAVKVGALPPLSGSGERDTLRAESNIRFGDTSSGIGAIALIGGRLLWPLPCNGCNRFRLLSCSRLPNESSLTCSGATVDVVVVVVVDVDDGDEEVLTRVDVSASNLVRIKSR